MSTCQGLSQCVNALGQHDRRCPAAPVTAVDVDALDKLREALAAAARERLPRGTYNPAYETDADDIADALLPVVDRIANERAAAELRAVGRAGLAATPGAHPVRVPVGYLFERADALDPS